MISSSIALFAGFALQGAAPASDAIAGGYAATGPGGSCHVLLMSPASRPPESLLVADATSGLAAVEPGCPLGLDDAGLWTLIAGENRLVLTGHDGEPVWTGMPAGAGRWSGAVPGGETVILARR